VARIPASLTGLIGNCEDISEQVRRGRLTARGDETQYEGAFAQLVRSMNTLADTFVSTFDVLPFPVFTIDPDHTLLYANKKTLEAAGTDKPLVGRKCGDVFNTAMCGTRNCLCTKAMETLQSSTCAARAGLECGERDIRGYAIPLAVQNGRAGGALEVVMDETDVLGTQKRIVEAAERARNLSMRMAAATGQLSGRVGEAGRHANDQAARATETATAMEQMNASVGEVARNVHRAARNAEQTEQKAMEGHGIVDEVTGSINQVRTMASSLKDNMNGLGSQAEDIGRVMTVITDIADQTNLLALNAAIEAARAGDAGRGFAVVADEVRKLAEKTMTATTEVGGTIGAIQSGTRRNMKETDKVAEVILNCSALAENAGEALVEIVSLSKGSSEQIQEIALAAEEQSSTSEHIARATDEMHGLSQASRDAMAEAAQACAELTDIVRELNELIEGLSTGGA